MGYIAYMPKSEINLEMHLWFDQRLLWAHPASCAWGLAHELRNSGWPLSGPAWIVVAGIAFSEPSSPVLRAGSRELGQEPHSPTLVRAAYPKIATHARRTNIAAAE